PECAILITDAISAMGMPDGIYKLGSFEVTVRGDCCEYYGKLVGSVLMLDRVVWNVMSFAGWKLQEAVRLAIFNFARFLGITSQKGVIAPGCDADLLLLSPEGHVV